ncbi:zinc finger family protein [Tripterygium wilfordii]|uniref:Zinc finger family protein n=1 Tax=Tripterygium wilfordii TaxID=458696 RepID=A0A7J7DEN4_TRIWF|nr:E3 ubiquitin-protein ligase RZFP34-like [Tripterygium wilfordii]KAF5744781.1 zinc finger family protein [Tripterygium wilfordii]
MGSGFEAKLSFEDSKVVEFDDKHVSLMDHGSPNHGCSHYKRGCKIRAPCCNEIFDCRHCHNDAKNAMEIDPRDQHDIPRHDIQKVICSLCNTEQDVQQNCINCGVCMGKYFCAQCKFFDDDVSKNQYHCDECGICRTGGKENFFHCKTCGCCYSKMMKDSHRCVERAMHHNCPVCFEFLFDTLRDITVLPCGHTIHLDCVKEMEKHYRYSCPVCSKSICDMTKLWRKLDQEIASTPMPAIYQNKLVWILCNDCGANSHVQFHIVANKCQSCESYNTRQTRGGPTNSCSSDMAEMMI